MGLGEADGRAPEGRFDGGPVGTALGFDGAGRRPADPRQACELDGVGHELVEAADDDGSAGGVDRQRVAAGAATDAEPAPLADSDELRCLDVPDDLAAGVDDPAGPQADSATEEVLAPT